MVIAMLFWIGSQNTAVSQTMPNGISACVQEIAGLDAASISMNCFLTNRLWSLLKKNSGIH